MFLRLNKFKGNVYKANYKKIYLIDLYKLYIIFYGPPVPRSVASPLGSVLPSDIPPPVALLPLVIPPVVSLSPLPVIPPEPSPWANTFSYAIGMPTEPSNTNARIDVITIEWIFISIMDCNNYNI